MSKATAVLLLALVACNEPRHDDEVTQLLDQAYSDLVILTESCARVAVATLRDPGVECKYFYYLSTIEAKNAEKKSYNLPTYYSTSRVGRAAIRGESMELELQSSSNES